jgi:nucleoid-associated protein YgaU
MLIPCLNRRNGDAAQRDDGMAISTVPGGALLRIVAVVALLLLAGVGAWFWQGGFPAAEDTAQRVEEPDRAAPVVAADENAAAGDAPEAADAPDTNGTAADARPDDTAAGDDAEVEVATAQPDTPPEELSAVETVSPSFDVVRVSPDGTAVIAGRAEPGSRVEVEIDGTLVGEAEADASGGFVAMLDLGHADTPRAMSLRSERDGAGAESEQVVVLAPSAAPAAPGEPDVPAPDAPEVPAVVEADEREPGQTELAEADGPDGDAASVDVSAPVRERAPSVILADRSGVRVLQGGETPPELADNVVIDAITYDTEGEVALSGRAPSDGSVRVYIDNAPVQTGAVGEGGQWQVDLPEVETGTYTLRVDQLDAAGEVVSRVETPFQREAPEAIRALAEEQEIEEPGQPLVELVTVQPGNTLWGISQRAFGEGTLFVRLFEANSDKIRDPDLIYPGQVFTLPN